MALRDLETHTILATTPWVVCGKARENLWCDAAKDSVKIPPPPPPPAAPGVALPTVYQIDRISIEDGKVQLVLIDALWGYQAGAEVFSDVSDGILMTVKVGDTLKMETLAVSGSRSTKPHNLTITGMDIDFTPEGRNPYEITFSKAGTFTVDDSTDPGAHGKFVIVVE